MVKLANDEFIFSVINPFIAQSFLGLSRHIEKCPIYFKDTLCRQVDSADQPKFGPLFSCLFSLYTADVFEGGDMNPITTWTGHSAFR